MVEKNERRMWILAGLLLVFQVFEMGVTLSGVHHSLKKEGYYYYSDSQDWLMRHELGKLVFGLMISLTILSCCLYQYY